jgi:hypothetical protein
VKVLGLSRDRRFVLLEHLFELVLFHIGVHELARRIEVLGLDDPIGTPLET